MARVLRDTALDPHSPLDLALWAYYSPAQRRAVEDLRTQAQACAAWIGNNRAQPPDSVARAFDEARHKWSKLEDGEAMTLDAPA